MRHNRGAVREGGEKVSFLESWGQARRKRRLAKLVVAGWRFCPECGGLVDTVDRALSTPERVWCKRCDHFIYMWLRWDERPIEGDMTPKRKADLAWLIRHEAEEIVEIRAMSKTIAIKPKYCTQCGHPISLTASDKYGGKPESMLQCTACSHVRFYEHVVAL